MATREKTEGFSFLIENAHKRKTWKQEEENGRGQVDASCARGIIGS